MITALVHTVISSSTLIVTLAERPSISSPITSPLGRPATTTLVPLGSPDASRNFANSVKLSLPAGFCPRFLHTT